MLISIMFMTSLSLYLALEYKKPLKKDNAVFVDKKKQPAAATQSKQKITTQKLNTNLKLDSIDEYGDSDLDGICGGDSYEET